MTLSFASRFVKKLSINFAADLTLIHILRWWNKLSYALWYYVLVLYIGGKLPGHGDVLLFKLMADCKIVFSNRWSAVYICSSNRVKFPTALNFESWWACRNGCSWLSYIHFMMTNDGLATFHRNINRLKYPSEKYFAQIFSQNFNWIFFLICRSTLYHLERSFLQEVKPGIFPHSMTCFFHTFVNGIFTVIINHYFHEDMFTSLM